MRFSKVNQLREMPESFLMSAVVLMELTAGARDESRRKSYEGIFRQYQKTDLLIVPNDEDWLLTAKILFLADEPSPPLRTWKTQTATARCVAAPRARCSNRRQCAAKGAVVTENWSDFKAIQRYCNAKIVKAAQFFKR